MFDYPFFNNPVAMMTVFAFVFALAWNWESITVSFRRRFGPALPIWSLDSRLLDVEYDAAGFVQSIIYCGYDGDKYWRKWWLRRWDRDAGLVWQRERAPDAASIATYADMVLHVGKGSRLTAVDARTGDERWSVPLPAPIKRGPCASGNTWIYLCENGFWLRLDPSKGTATESGTLASQSGEDPLFDGTDALCVAESAGWLEVASGECLVRMPGSSDLLGRVAVDEVGYDRRAVTLGVCCGPVVLDSDTSDTSIVVKRRDFEDPRQERPLHWSETMVGLVNNDVYMDGVEWFQQSCAVSVQYIETERQAAGLHALWLVDLARRKVLLQISDKLDCWVAGAGGRESARF